MSKLLALLGLPYMDTTTLLVVLGLAFSIGVISGWIADLIMGQHTFGIPMNGIILIGGGILGLLLLKYSGFQYKGPFLVLAMTCAAVSATFCLLMCAFLRRFF